MRMMLMVACVLFVVAGTLQAADFDARAERYAAAQAEKAGDFDAALLHYENIYDSTPTTPQERVELRHKFEKLHPKVKPNTDPAKAGLYKVRVYVFRKTEIGSVRHTYTDKQIQDLDKCAAAWSAEVWKATLGNLRIVHTLKVIDQPLTKIDGLPDCDNCMPYLTDLKPGEVDLIAVFALTNGLPHNAWAATWGIVGKGAMYMGFNDGGDGATSGDGEVQVHEWLHAVQNTLDGQQNYPVGLSANPDSGMDCGKDCWKPAGKKNLYDWYRHIISVHATRKMWRGLSVTHPAESLWTAKLNLCDKFLAVGPFDIKPKDKGGMDVAYIDEQGAKPSAGAAAGGQGWFASQRVWTAAAASGRDLNFANLYYPLNNRAAYLATVVRSAKEQFAQVRVGSDDSVKVWQDGKVILADATGHECGVDQNIVNVRLKKGDNLFLMKVINNGGDWTANLRVTDPAGNAPSDTQYALPGEQLKRQ